MHEIHKLIDLLFYTISEIILKERFENYGVRELKPYVFVALTLLKYSMCF